MMIRLEKIESDLAAATDVRQKIDLLNELSWTLRDINEARALKLAQEAFQLAQAEQYAKGLGYSLVYQGLYEAFGDIVLAHARVIEAMNMFEQMEDPIGQNYALFVLGGINYNLSNFSDAVEIERRALVPAQARGDLALEAEILNLMGIAYCSAEQHEIGFAVMAQGLAICRASGERVHTAKILHNLAWWHTKIEKFDLALEYARESLSLCDDLTYSLYGHSLTAMGRAYAAVHATENALFHYQQALAAAHDQGDRQLSKTALYFIGELYIQEEKLDQAIRYIQSSLALAEEVKSNFYISLCHQALSRIYETQGDLARALEHYKQFHAVQEEMFNEKNTKQIQILGVMHQTELARREAEIYQSRNTELEREIAERKLLEEKLRHLAITDELTGITNRRHFLELSKHHIKHALRLERTLALAVMDLDYFKQINDTYGHAAGDRALIAFVKTVQKNIREIDLLARFGGDEFVLLFLESDTRQAYQVFDRIRRELAANHIQVEGRAFSITMTVGIAGLVNQDDTIDLLLARADKALYRAKEAGRNRVEIEN